MNVMLRNLKHQGHISGDKLCMIYVLCSIIQTFLVVLRYYTIGHILLQLLWSRQFVNNKSAEQKGSKLHGSYRNKTNIFSVSLCAQTSTCLIYGQNAMQRSVKIFRHYFIPKLRGISLYK